MAEAIAKSLPILAQSIATGVPQLVTPICQPEEPGTSDTGNYDQSPDVTPKSSQCSRFERFYAPEKKVQLSGELLTLTTQAFVKSLSRETWKALIENYPEIQGTESVLIAPSIEAGMKEDIQRKHGLNKTKEVFAFDEGQAEKQATFLLTARPILAALTALDGTGEELDEDETPDPDAIKGMLEDALVLLGNANARLNSWRQRRFADFLTPIGKRTLKEAIPTDKHLFPEELHERIKSEHSHSTTNNSLISKPFERPRFQPG